MGVTKQALEQAFVDNKPKYGGLKEDYFALLYLAEETGRRVEDLAHQVAAGIDLTASPLSIRANFAFHHRSRWATKPRCFANRSSGIPLRRHALSTPRASTFDHFPCAIEPPARTIAESGYDVTTPLAVRLRSNEISAECRTPRTPK